MKLRSLICLGALVVAGAASAEIAAPTSNTFGWLRVDSTKQYTIVAVPWLGCDGTAVKVADLVKVDNLTPEDMLYVYQDGAYKAWVLRNGVWTPTTTVAEGKRPTAAAGAAETALARGSALWLYRQNATNPFYVYGQHSADTASAPALTPGAYNLVANPNASGYDLNSGKITGAAKGDQVQVVGDAGVTRVYTFDGTNWGYDNLVPVEGKPFSRHERVTTGCTIPAGQGVWYVSKGTTAPTIKW